MSAITVRNLDERTRDGLKALASRHGRSMESEARVILTAAVTPTAVDQGGLGSRIAALFADEQWSGSERSDEPARAAALGS